MDGDLVLSLRVIDPVELGTRIKRLRKQRGLTQSQLAGEVASTAYVSRIEAGLRRPEPVVLEGLARNLGVQIRELLEGGAAPQRSLAQLELDYAELELRTGSAGAARARLAALPAALDDDHRQLAGLLHALSDQALGYDVIGRLTELASEEPANITTWFRTQMALCRALRDNGELDAAATAGERALGHVRSLDLTGTDDGIQLAVTLAGIYEMRGEIPRALRLAEATLAGADESSTPRSRAYVYWNASACEAEQGNVAAAIEYAQRAIALLGPEGDVRQRALLRTNVGRFHLLGGSPDPDAALALLAEARQELVHSSASASELATNSIETARAQLMRGDRSAAGSLIEEVLAHQEGLGAHMVADALVLRGEILLHDDADAARSCFHDAVLKLSGAGQDRGVARLWYRIAATFEVIGDATSALDAYRRAGVASGVGPIAALSTLLS